MSSRELRDDGGQTPDGGVLESSALASPWGSPAGAADRGVLARLGSSIEAERAHWFYWVPVAIGCGIAFYFSLPFEPPIAAGILAVIGMLGLRFAVPAAPLSRVLVDVLLLAAVGFSLIALRTWWVSAPILEQRIEPVEIKGFIELIEPRDGPGERLTLWVTHMGKLDPSQWPQRVRIRTIARGVGFAPGDAVTVRAQLAPPGGPALPGGFDFARQAYFSGIGAVGFAVSMPLRDTHASEPPLALRISAAVQGLRGTIGARVDQVLNGSTAAIAKALLTGERGGIPESTNDAYRSSGIFHILSISGLHMAIMGGAVFWLVRFILALIPSIALRYPIKKWAAIAAIAGSLAYLAISGGAFATVRSFIMITIMFFAILLDRPAIALRNVALSALVILVLFPESLLDVGFQMSFAAVVALVAAYEMMRARFGDSRPRQPGWSGMVGLFLGGIIISTVIASAAVTPFAIYHFHKTQHYAVLANLLAVPICNLVVMPAALATLVLMPLGLEWAPLVVMGFGIDVMSAVARLVGGLPGAVGVLPSISTSAFGFMLAGGLWLTLWQRRARLGGLALICVGIAIAPFAARPDVLIGRDGKLVALRNAAGKFVAVSTPQSIFELKRWLEHDGDGRNIDDVVAAPGPTCDSVGCVMDLRGLRVAISRHAASIADDCAMAGLLILSVPALKGCVGPRLVVDFFDVRNKGTHAIYVEGPHQLKVETVEERRGERPWAPQHNRSSDDRQAMARDGDAKKRVSKNSGANNAPAASVDAEQNAVPSDEADGGQSHRGTSAPASSHHGVSRFAAPLDLLDAGRTPRPEIDDELSSELDEARN